MTSVSLWGFSSLTGDVMVLCGWVLTSLGAAGHQFLTLLENVTHEHSLSFDLSLLFSLRCIFARLHLHDCLSAALFIYFLFLERFSEAHGAGGGTRRPRTGRSCCHSGRRQSRCWGEVRGVRLQRSAQWSHLSRQEHPWLQAQKVRETFIGLHFMSNRFSLRELVFLLLVGMCRILKTSIKQGYLVTILSCQFVNAKGNREKWKRLHQLHFSYLFVFLLGFRWVSRTFTFLKMQNTQNSSFEEKINFKTFFNL